VAAIPSCRSAWYTMLLAPSKDSCGMLMLPAYPAQYVNMEISAPMLGGQGPGQKGWEHGDGVRACTSWLHKDLAPITLPATQVHAGVSNKEVLTGMVFPQGRTMRYAGVTLRLTSGEVEEGLKAHSSCPDELLRFMHMER